METSSTSRLFTFSPILDNIELESFSPLFISPSLKEKSTKDITTLLETCESYMNWLNPLVPLTEENIRLYIQRINSKFIVPNELFERAFVFKYSGFEHVSHLGALCYFYLSLNKLSEAKNTIEKAREFVLQSVGSGYIPEEFVESFDYVWDYLRLHVCIKEWELSSRSEKRTLFQKIDLISLINDFEKELTPEAKAGVWGLKQYFYRLQNVPYEKQIDVIKKAIALQPEHYEWHYCLSRILRSQRRERQSIFSPSFSYSFKEEIDEICLANKLAPEQPIIILAKIQLLAEIARTQFIKPYWEIIKFGPHNFSSMILLRSFIKEQAQKIQKLYCNSIRINVMIAKIFSRVLPHPHQDYIYAKECLERTIELHPYSSRANEQIGLLYLTHELNMEQAEIYLGIAFNLDARNYQALLYLIQVMMNKVVKRKLEILDLIDKQLVNTFWNKRQNGNLHFLKAYIFLANSNPKEAVEEFITAYKLCTKSISFHELSFQNRRFNWPSYPKTALITLPRIKYEIRKAESMATDLERKEILSNILDLLQLAKDYENKLSESRFKMRYKR